MGSACSISRCELARMRTLGPGGSKDLIEAHELAIRDLENEDRGPARQQQRPGGVRHRDATPPN